MLVLSRKLGEKLVLGDLANRNAVVVTVVDIDRGRVRLAVEAAPDVKISRTELLPGGTSTFLPGGYGTLKDFWSHTPPSY